MLLNAATQAIGASEGDAPNEVREQRDPRCSAGSDAVRCMAGRRALGRRTRALALRDLPAGADRPVPRAVPQDYVHKARRHGVDDLMREHVRRMALGRGNDPQEEAAMEISDSDDDEDVDLHTILRETGPAQDPLQLPAALRSAGLLTAPLAAGCMHTVSPQNDCSNMHAVYHVFSAIQEKQGVILHSSVERTKDTINARDNSGTVSRERVPTRQQEPILGALRNGVLVDVLKSHNLM